MGSLREPMDGIITDICKTLEYLQKNLFLAPGCLSLVDINTPTYLVLSAGVRYVVVL